MSTAFKQVASNAKATVVSNALNNTTSPLAFSIQSGKGALFPAPGNGFYITAYDASTYSDPSDDPNMRVGLCTARTTDSLTVTWGQFSTPVVAIPGTPTIFLGVHDQLLKDIHTAINAAEAILGTGAGAPSAGKVLRGTGAGTSAWGAADLTADVTGTLPVGNGGTGVTSITSGNYVKGAGSTAFTSSTPASVAAEIGALLYPVGAIYIATVSTNPATLLGFGTWTAFAAGRTIIGVGTSDQAFAAAATGGESNHTLITAEMPSHTHGYGQPQGTSGAGTGLVDGPNQTSSGTHNTASNGSGSAHNNLPPYIVAYMWQRTA